MTAPGARGRLVLGALGLAVFFLASTARAAAPWREAVTPSFRFRFTEPDARSVAYLVEFAEDAKARIDADLGAEGGAPVRVDIAPDRVVYNAIQPGDRPPPAWSAAMAYPNEGRIVMLSGRRTREVGLGATFRHEYAHIALGRVAGGRPLPAWLQEGFAIYHSGEWTLERAARVTGRILQGRAPYLRDLERFTSLDPREAEDAYALSFHLIAYLHRTYGSEGFRRLIGALAGGASATEALEAMSGGYWRRVESDWRESLEIRYGYLPVGAVTTAAWSLGAGALFAGWLRRRHENRRILAAWERDEATRPWSVQEGAQATDEDAVEGDSEAADDHEGT